MIKRAIILILILGGLYWLTTSLRNDPTQTPIDKKTETTEDKKVEDNKKVTEDDSDIKDSEKTEKKTEEKKDEVKKETPVETEKEEVTTTKLETKKEVVKEEELVKEEIIEVSVPKVIKKITPEISYPDRITTIKVYLYEWAVDISSKEIPSGTVQFEVVNNGKFSHDFNIKGIQNFGKVPPRQSANFTAKFLPGNFEIFSDRRDDYENGMKEDILIVK